MLYDVLVLGSGPAGLTAALFAARAGLSVLVLGSDAGSSLSEATRLDNFPGFGDDDDDDETMDRMDDDDFGGSAWIQQTKRKAMKAGAKLAQSGLLASNLQISSSSSQRRQDTIFQIDVENRIGRHHNKLLQVPGRSVILAMGATGQRLGVALEDELWGTSIHNCAVCDGNSYVNQVVVVVGGGDAAVDAALLLSRYAKRVVLVHRRMAFRASSQRHVDLLQTTNNIQIATPFEVKEFHVRTTSGANRNDHKKDQKNQKSQTTKATQLLTGVRLQNTETNQEQSIRCDGVFVMIGSKPNTEWLLKESNGEVSPGRLPLEVDSNGYILLDNNNNNSKLFSTATTVAGIFAAGEVTDQVYRQAITAAAEGAQAAMDAERWLRTTTTTTTTTTNREMSTQQQQEQQQQAVIPLQTIPTIPAHHHQHHHHDHHQSLRGGGQSDDHDDARPAGEQRKTRQQGQGQQQRVQQQQQGQQQQQQRETPAITCDVAQVACLDHVVHQHPLVIFSQPRCPQCQQLMETLALEGLSEHHPNVNVINVSKLGTTKANKIRATLKEMTGRKSFPSVFLSGKWIAGEAQTRLYQKQGKLKDMLLKAGVYNHNTNNVDETTAPTANRNNDGQEEL